VSEPELAEDLREQLARLRPALESDPRVIAVFLFGSQVDGYATQRSDVDLAVLFSRPLSLMEEAGFLADLCRAVGSDNLDLVNLNKASLILQYRAISGLLVYERDADRVSDFIEHVTLRYIDFKPMLDEFERQYDLAMEEAYGV
jgi:predicted nucleotidyltransferase